jgi:hypothetical protein
MIDTFLLLNSCLLVGLIFTQNDTTKEQRASLPVTPVEKLTWATVGVEFCLFLAETKS